jgi:hypothetical protein
LACAVIIKLTRRREGDIGYIEIKSGKDKLEVFKALFFIYQILRNNCFPQCHLQLIIELRKAVSLSQIFFPKVGFFAVFWKREAAKLLWATFVTRRPCQVLTSRFQPVFGADIFVLIRIMDPYH